MVSLFGSNEWSIKEHERYLLNPAINKANNYFLNNFLSIIFFGHTLSSSFKIIQNKRKETDEFKFTLSSV